MSAPPVVGEVWDSGDGSERRMVLGVYSHAHDPSTDKLIAYARPKYEGSSYCYETHWFDWVRSARAYRVMAAKDTPCS